MKTIILATAIALAAAAPALAKSPRPMHAHASQHALDANASLKAADPFGASTIRSEIARDGDAAARQLGRWQYFNEQYGG